MMIGDKVAPDDEYWQSYLDLLTITDYLLSPEITEDNVANLATMISDHHLQFKVSVFSCIYNSEDALYCSYASINY